MGFLRLFLALVVVAGHTMPTRKLPSIGGELAVRLFFIVSGFYMTLILAEKYNSLGRGGLQLFYSNRALRIFPLLWFVLGVELLMAVAVPWYTGTPWASWPGYLERLWLNSRLGSIGLIALSQISGFGVDLFHLVSFDPSGLPHSYQGTPGPEGFRGWHPFPMSHAWSISCELVFYLLAPWLVRCTTGFLIGLASASALLVPIWVRITGPSAFGHICSSFAAPCQIGYFVLGVLAYRVYRHPSWSPTLLSTPLQVVVAAIFFICCIFYSKMRLINYTGTLSLLYGSAAITIPILFSWSQHLSWDRRLGDLSYPCYLLHVSVIRVFDLPALTAGTGKDFHETWIYFITVAVITILLSFVVARTIDFRLDSYRQARLLRASKGS